MAERRDLRVARKCHELKQQGLKWGEIAETLPSLGPDYLDVSGNPYSRDTLMTMYSNNKDLVHNDLYQDEQKEDESEVRLARTVKALVKVAVEDEIVGIRKHLESTLRGMVQEEVTRRLGSEGSPSETREFGSEELPPQPRDLGRSPGSKGKGRLRQNRKYVKKALTIDVNLWDIFQQHKRRLGISSDGLMADLILWNYYGKPSLSYSESEKEGQTVDLSGDELG